MGDDEPRGLFKVDVEKRLKRLIIQKNWNDLEEWSKKYKKITPQQVREKMKNSNSYMKNLNLKESRVLFRKASSTLHTVRHNWKHDKRYREEGLDCVDCLALDPPVIHPDHQDVLVTPTCQGNSDLRQGRRMSEERDVAHFFIDLIDRRIKNYGGKA